MKKQFFTLLLALMLAALCAVPAMADGAMETINYSNGDVYVGGVVNGLPNGIGTYTLASGQVYHGEMVDGYFHGIGIYVWPEGGSYTGSFVKDAFEGKGMYCYSDGTYYIGDFSGDKRNGQGTLYAADGSVLQSGTFVDNKFTGGAAAAAPAAAPAVTSDLKAEDVIGVWTCISLELEGTVLQASLLGIESTMTFNADGTCKMTLADEVYNDTWEIEDGKIVMGGDALEIVDGQLIMTLEGNKIIFTRN